MRRPTRLAATAVLAATTAFGFALPAAVSTPALASATTVNTVRLNGFEARLLADINAARRNHGLVPLQIAAGSTDVARRWAHHLAGHRFLSHNPDLVHDLSHAGSGSWRDIAENVGEGPASDPDWLFRAYMNSPEHRANILDRYSRYVGIGVVQRGTTAWNTIDFVDTYNSHYGRTRVPADGLTMDRKQISRTTDIATLESVDQRFRTKDTGGARAGRIQFRQFSGNGGAYAVLRGGRSGMASILMEDALDLSKASGLRVQIAAHDSEGRPVPVVVSLRRSYGSSVKLGTVRAPGHSSWFGFSLPKQARTFRNTLVLSVPAKAISAAGGSVKLVTFDVRAVA